MKSKIIPLFLLLSCLCTAVYASDTAKETARLEKNWRALQARKLDVVPVPKFIDFKKPVELKKIVIVGNDKIPYFKVICEEITSRIADIGSKVPVTVSPKRIAGAYNIIVEKAPLKHKRYQSYTLTPVKDGMILQGKENALYAVVTLRFLIAQEKGKTILHTAKVLDYPDYAGRRAYIFAPWIWSKDPQKTLELAKPYIRAAFRSKLNAIALQQHPAWRAEIRIHREPLEKARKILEQRAPVKTLRLINDYAKSLGIRNGVYYTTHALGTKQDKDDPQYRQMMYWQCHDHYFSWARTDLHRKKAAIILDFLKRSGCGNHNSHCVDGGFMDPENWSKRDKLTREKFGNDRAAAGAAVWKEYIKDHEKNDIVFAAVVYPYSGRLLTHWGIKKIQGMPDSPQTTKIIDDYLKKILAYCKRINELMPPHATFLCREAPPAEALAYYNAYKNRKVEINWYNMELMRDIEHNLPQEIRAFRSNYHEPIGDKLTMATIGGSMLQTPALVLTGEYSWNTLFPGWETLDRTRNPDNYDLKKAAINAERAAEGFYGMKAGKYLAPVYDKFFSFQFAVNPVKATVNISKPLDLMTMSENNHKQLLVALDSVKKALKLDKKDFKADSYDEFIEIYLRLKAAKVYSIASLAELRIAKAAKTGDFELCKKLYEEAMAGIKSSSADYYKAQKAVNGKYNAIPRGIFKPRRPTYWLTESTKHLAGRLFFPYFSDAEKRVQKVYDEKENTFAKWNIPVWFKKFIQNQKNVYISRKGSSFVEHFILFSDGNSFRNLSKDYRLCLPAPKVEMYNVSGGLRFKGTIANPDLHKQPQVKLDNKTWPPADSFEIYLAPPASDIGKIFHFVLDPGGNLLTRRLHDPKNIGVKFTSPYNFGKKIPFKVIRNKDSWSFDITIPLRLIGAKPKAGANWKVLFGYNKGPMKRSWHESYWSQPLTEGRATNFKNYHNLNFVPENYTPEPHVELLATQLKAENRTHERGAGTMVSFTPVINSFSPLKNVSLSARFFDAKGSAISKDIPIAKNTDIQAAWQSPNIIKYQAEMPHKTMYLQLKAEIPGQKDLIRYIQIGKIDAANLASGSKTPAILKSGKAMPFKKGKLSFTVKANWSGVDRRNINTQTLLYAGSFNRRKLSYADMILIRHNPNGVMQFIIAIPNWKGVRIGSAMWKPEKGKAHKLEFIWDMTKAPVSIKILCDGKQISAPRVTGWGGKPELSVPKLGTIEYQPVFGALPDGTMPFDGTISDIQY